MTTQEIESVYESFRAEFAPYAMKPLNQNETLAEEAMQETLVRAAEKQSRFNHKYGRRGMYSWLLKILGNVCREMQNRKRHQHDEGFDYEEVIDTRNAFEVVEDALVAEYEHSILSDIIAGTHLTNLEWAVVTATRLGFTTAEIAPELGMATNGVRAHLCNAMPRLRQTAQAFRGCLDHRRAV